MNEVFSHIPGLLTRHYEALCIGSGISDEVIKERGYRSATGRTQLRDAGFTGKQSERFPSLLIPVHTTDGSIALNRSRPDFPREDSDGKSVKYEQPVGVGLRLDCPPRCQPMLADPRIDLWITEGEKKADALSSQGLCAIGLLGVHGFLGRDQFGTSQFLVDWRYVAVTPERNIHIAFDSDIHTNRQIQSAALELAEHIKRMAKRAR